MYRGLDFITSLDGLCMIPTFLIGAWVLSVGLEIVFISFGAPPISLMGGAWRCAGAVFGAGICRIGVQAITGPLGAKTYVERTVSTALSKATAPSCAVVVRAAILYHYPIPDEIRADAARTPAMQRLAGMLTDENPGFTYYVVQENTDDTDDVVLFTVGSGQRKAAIVWTSALAKMLDE